MDLCTRLEELMDCPVTRYVEECWPTNIEEVFDVARGGGFFHIEDEPMDNVVSMRVFLQTIPNENILLDDGTQVFLAHPKYAFNLQVDSGGGGDFHIHVFELTQIPKL